MVNKGFVGFLDILGYQTIIKNNEISKTSELISEVIINLPTNTSDLLISFLKTEERKNSFKSEVLKINTQLISDSILISMSLQDETDVDKISFSACVFLSYTSLLMRQSFDKGLPLRGAIDYGEFFLSGNCFAGKPIINCYSIGEQMDAAGCVISNDFYKVIEDNNLNLGNRLSHRLNFDCMNVNKNGINERCKMLNWYYPYSNWGSTESIDIRSYVINAFQSHGKDIAPDVISKVNNTEIMLHRAISDVNSKIKK
jgi:hypothetical protein